jgi:cell division protein FtsX
MNQPPRKKNPTFGIAVFIVVAVLLVIATLFYNAIKEKRDFDTENAPSVSVASGAAAAAATATSAAATAGKPASGTAQ